MSSYPVQRHSSCLIRQHRSIVGLEIRDPRSRKGRAETKPAALQRLGIQIVYNALPVDEETGMTMFALDLHMIPVVGLQQVIRIGIFFQNGRTPGRIVHTSLVTVVAAEPGRGVVVAAIAEVVHLQRIASHEDAAAPSSSCPEAFGLRVTG